MPNWKTCLVAASTVALTSFAAHAGISDELFKALSDDSAAGDEFGIAVAADGAFVVLGARKNDENGSNAGAAYVFDIASGNQLRKLTPDDAAAGDEFGGEVAIDGQTALIGARLDGDGIATGSAYVFDVTTGQQMFKLLPDDGDIADFFGFAVAVSGTTAIVGAPFDNDDTNGEDAGSAYLFDTTTGAQLFKLLPNDGGADHRFGISVGISGNIAIVGAYVNSNNGVNAGAAYFFDTTTGQQLFQNLNIYGDSHETFGISVAISGNTAVIGAQGNTDSGIQAGAAYLYDATTGQRITQILASDGAAGDNFGQTVAINGNRAIIGSPFHDLAGISVGAAYVFDAATGQQISRLHASDGEMFDTFGIAVSMVGDTAVVGAYLEDEGGNNAGAAYAYTVSGCTADLNCDSVTDTADLGILLALFGTADPGADINADGAIDTADLGILLGAFGSTCP